MTATIALRTGMRAATVSLLLAAALSCCALFTPARSCPEVSVAPALPTRAAFAGSQSAPAPTPTAAPRPSVSDVVASPGFHLRRSMTVAVAPLRSGERDLVFDLLQRILARRAVRVLDLSRTTELQAKVADASRDRGTTLEGPWLAAVWAARWGGASHILVSDNLATAAHSSGSLARGRFRLLSLPGAEVVWTARLSRAGDTDEDALARTLDALVDALHGTLRDDPEEASQTTPAPPRERRRNRRNRHR